jgi:DtxR family Mn-dependent transcriptional regulator
MISDMWSISKWIVCKSANALIDGNASNFTFTIKKLIHKVNNESSVITSITYLETISETRRLKMEDSGKQEEELYIGTAESEHIEMYLKALWYIHERGQEVKISSIAKLLNVTQPSVVQMLHKLNNDNLVNYKKGNVVEMTAKGEGVGKQMIRNTRLLEVLMQDSLKIEIDEEMVCGIEHHMKTIFTDALCTLLKHPRKCPHGHSVPMGKCCR